MTSHEYRLQNETPKATTAPLNIYCARPKCNIIIRKGTPVYRYDAATMVHATCPTRRLRNFAAHKQPGFEL
jgi:hypothetical protein